MTMKFYFICSNELKNKVAMTAITNKIFDLDKPCWIAALMDAHKR